MGMYTEFHFNAELRDNTPPEVLNALSYMLDSYYALPCPLPDHPLFSTTRWRIMLVCSSTYFAARTHSVLEKDEYGDGHFLSVRSNFKNYSDEIQKFLDWIMPHVASSDDFLGFYRYEEDREPTLIYRTENTHETHQG